MVIFTKNFWAYALDRALKTAAQVVIAGVTVASFVPNDGNAWLMIGQTAGIAALVSVLTSLTAYTAASGSESTPASTVSQSETVSLFTVK